MRWRPSVSNPLQSRYGPLMYSRTRSIGDVEPLGVRPNSSAKPSIDWQILSTESGTSSLRTHVPPVSVVVVAVSGCSTVGAAQPAITKPAARVDKASEERMVRIKPGAGGISTEIRINIRRARPSEVN